MATLSLSHLMEDRPEHRSEARQDLQFLNAQKMGEHEAEMERSKSVFFFILQDIKNHIDNGKQPSEITTDAMLQTMRDDIKGQKQEPLSMDDVDVTDMTAGQIRQFVPVDEETTEQFRQLTKKMMEQARKTNK